jgi:hypothetical protein
VAVSSIDWPELVKRLQRIRNASKSDLERLYCMECYKSTFTVNCQHCGSDKTRKLKTLKNMAICVTGLMRKK